MRRGSRDSGRSSLDSDEKEERRKAEQEELEGELQEAEAAGIELNFFNDTFQVLGPLSISGCQAG